MKDGMSANTIDYSSGGLRVAVIGGGISGIVASHLISRRNKVTLFEKGPRLGGHTHTVMAGKNAATPVDMGFIVFNEPNYPVFNKFLGKLGVEKGESDMSFAFHDPVSGFMYAGTGLRGMLARWSNLVSPTFWRMLSGMRRFAAEARKDLHNGTLSGITIGEYLDERGYSRDFEDRYLLPMAGAIWSAPEGKARNFPAEALVRFFDNHILLDYLSRPIWHYVKGGSQTYVRAFSNIFSGETRCDTPVVSVKRSPDSVTVLTDAGAEEFDAVVLATHADISLRLLETPSKDETALLSPWSYASNRVTLHTDTGFLPPTEMATAAWNFVKEPERSEDAPVGVSYHMNRLQHIPSPPDFVVTLNPVRKPRHGSLIESVQFDHPQYSLDSQATQSRLPELNGRNRTFFCGAYQGYGFHEDGAASAQRVAQHFGESL